eukprot:gnl/Chilomastix_caulleri/1543.p3 GENE.gnl/Chilomastix_caulleri/1543~~gnl/Chilomastix_caulleri/1543.p3  ORF type:complete len:52 (-),score=11.84 gnl/Chilomastix_caulleri/1543:416-571(-)
MMTVSTEAGKMISLCSTNISAIEGFSTIFDMLNPTDPSSPIGPGAVPESIP